MPPVLSFYPRPCARGDDHRCGGVSIHAARGATPRSKARARHCTFCFYPRPCARGDGTVFDIWTDLGRFYPRPCARGASFALPVQLRVSIHAPARGATTNDRRVRLQVGVSIHAPLERIIGER